MTDPVRQRVRLPPFPAVGDALRHAIRAAVLDDERGDAAWRHWIRSLDGRTLAATEKQIAPLLYRTRLRRGIDAAARSLLEPFSSRAWAKHQLDRGTLTDTLARLRGAGIDALVLKGAALIPLYYRDPAARFAGDIDILVPVRRHREAARIFLDRGWSATPNPATFDTRFGHAIQCYRPGTGIDVHCHVLLHNCEHGADDGYWDAAVPMADDSDAGWTLSPTHHLLHLCFHGAMFTRVPSVRWYLDAATVLRVAESEIDWDRLVADARTHRITSIVRLAFDGLREVLDLPLPDAPLRDLAATRVGRVERLMRATTMTRRDGRPLLILGWNAMRFYRATHGFRGWRRWRQFPAYLRFWLAIPRWWMLPVRLVVKLWESLVRRGEAEVGG